jgi:hypothetical protein
MAYADSKEWKKIQEKFTIRLKPEYSDREKQDRVKIKSATMETILGEYIEKVYDGTIDKGIVRNKALEILGKVRKTAQI